MIKPPHGEYIAVERLESVYKNSAYIDNICVYACGHKNEILALVNPNKKNLHALAQQKQIDTKNEEELCNNLEIRKAILTDLQKVARTSGLKTFECVSGVKIYPEEWTPENGILTAAMKLKRFEIYNRFKEDINDLYEELEK